MPRSWPGPVTGAPSSSTCPELAFSRPARMRIRVDLPQPEGPITHTNSRRCTMKSMPRKASVSPLAVLKVLPSCLSSSTTSRAWMRAKRSATAGLWRWYNASCAGNERTELGGCFMSVLLCSAVPGKKRAPQPLEQHVAAEPDHADDHDRGVHVLE